MVKKQDVAIPPVQTADELSGEVSIRVSIGHFPALTIGARSRAIAAFDRLSGAAGGWPAAYLEGLRRRAELRGRIREQLIEAQGKLALQLLEKADGPAALAVERAARDLVRKQLNREAVLLKAAEALEAEPVAEAISSESIAVPEKAELDADWINVFADYVEKASSSRLQDLWGRILAGEIRRPTAFSLTTLRVVSELDAEIATAFQEVVSLRLPPDILIQPKKMKGHVLDRWALLQDVGLVHGVGGHLRTVVFDHQDAGTRAIATPHYALRLTCIGGIEPLRVPTIKMTRVGKQIASILPWDEQGALRRLANFAIANTHRMIIELGTATHVGGQFIFNDIERLRPLA